MWEQGHETREESITLSRQEVMVVWFILVGVEVVRWSPILDMHWRCSWPDLLMAKIWHGRKTRVKDNSRFLACAVRMELPLNWDGEDRVRKRFVRESEEFCFGHITFEKLIRCASRHVEQAVAFPSLECGRRGWAVDTDLSVYCLGDTGMWGLETGEDHQESGYR